MSDDPKEQTKRETAIQLLNFDENALSLQVLQEFYVQATRPTRHAPLSHEFASGLIRTWQRFKIQEITMAVMLGALEIRSRYRLSYWDSAIVSAASTLGCRELYSEDIQDGQVIEGIRIINPFN